MQGEIHPFFARGEVRLDKHQCDQPSIRNGTCCTSTTVHLGTQLVQIDLESLKGLMTFVEDLVPTLDSRIVMEYTLTLASARGKLYIIQVLVRISAYNY